MLSRQYFRILLSYPYFLMNKVNQGSLYSSSTLVFTDSIAKDICMYEFNIHYMYHSSKCFIVSMWILKADKLIHSLFTLALAITRRQQTIANLRTFAKRRLYVIKMLKIFCEKYLYSRTNILDQAKCGYYRKNSWYDPKYLLERRFSLYR